MALFEDPFAKPQGWRITGWKKPDDNSIPQKIFAPTGTLLIGIVKEATKEEPALYNLSWLDESGRWCSMTGLHVSPTEQNLSQLTGVNSASLDGKPSEWAVVLTMNDRDNTAFTGKLNRHIGEDSHVGTLTAMANPIGGEPPAHRRSPHWLLWLRRLFGRVDEPRQDKSIAV
jgi:hypothetical protein